MHFCPVCGFECYCSGDNIEDECEVDDCRHECPVDYYCEADDEQLDADDPLEDDDFFDQDY